MPGLFEVRKGAAIILELQYGKIADKPVKPGTCCVLARTISRASQKGKILRNATVARIFSPPMRLGPASRVRVRASEDPCRLLQR